MTNEEKAAEIINGLNFPMSNYNSGKYDGAIEMGEWKDRQFKEYLEKKKRFHELESESLNHYDMPTKEEREINRAIAYAINEMIEELFKKKAKC